MRLFTEIQYRFHEFQPMTNLRTLMDADNEWNSQKFYSQYVW